MACQLQNAGRRVDGVVLIDSPYPINHQPLPDAIIAYLTGLQQSPSSTAFAADSPAQSRRERVLAQFQTNAAMLGKYKPTTTTTTLPTFKVVMLQSRDSFDSEALCGIQYSWLGEQEDRERAIRAWRKLLGREMPVLKIPGNHFEPFKRENVSITMTYNPSTFFAPSPAYDCYSALHFPLSPWPTQRFLTF